MRWFLKICAKVALSRMPIGYAMFRRVGIFRHGAMDSAGYAVDVFETHLRRALERGLPRPFVALEIGPGDSVASAVLACAAGASATYLIDAGPFATEDMKLYGQIADVARRKGYEIPAGLRLDNLPALLESCNACYLATGLRNFGDIPSASVDFIWSQAVLEHVRLREFNQLVAETWRVLRPGGIASHRVDLQDHLGGSLNNLRFPDALWESPLMAESGFYTNRIRFGEMLDLFRNAGFLVEVLGTDQWPAVPVSRSAVAKRFRSCADDDLRVRGFDVVLSRRASPVDRHVSA